MLRTSLALIIAAWLAHGSCRAASDPEQVAKQVRFSVVAIAVHAGQRPRPDDRSDEATNPAVRFTTKGAAMGSGVLISADGLVLTVASVLEPPGDITVTFEGGATKQAQMVGKDSRSGLALLRVNGPIPAFASLKPQALPALGERVVAIGRTVLEDETFPVVSDGIASAVADSSPRTMPFIQSTAQLLPGMGGGPLVSQKTGEIVGINSMIYVSKSFGATMAFAVPIQDFLKIKDQLIARGRVVRPAIGINVGPLTDEVRTNVGLAGSDGVLIVGVKDGGAAARGGLRQGDIVLKADGTAVRTAGGLFEAIGARPPGEVLQLVVFRNGTQLALGIRREELAER